MTVDSGDGVAVVTLDRPDRHNAIDRTMRDQLQAVWRQFRMSTDVRVVVLTGAGDKAFCTGLDRAWAVPQPFSPYAIDDPLIDIGPKSADLWIPVIAAVNGMACGGAFYLLAECEFAIAADHATFFDPHTTYGMVSAFESIGMAQRMPYGEVMRMSLMGTAERIGARRAYEIGIVSELVPGDGLLDAAMRAARVIASYPTEAVQGTVRAVWSARAAARSLALAGASQLIALGNLPPERQEALFRTRRGDHRVR
ncbi:enoyl-CoA hydratase/isomerase family protein [Streptomyces silvisoli]|uniref:Enoyl-CoA hydratase/isomerase family protein n=1 Tax=Streptomyces silvisoli TaxID=3034235 RepID=A0ABT5ZUU3_9ACTN|nr:enoyl-CoA hydratase/isomerase family protein [Streptomyces silvisoli]MDF3293421.1 enoyl-CoA hydratase/isomerase family protein [Streptomyces silvisoli]